MRRLRLTEFKREAAVPLTIAERDGLRRLYPGLRIEPTAGQAGHYDVTCDERVGLLSLPGLTVEIRPKIPMASVLFLVSYACDLARWDDREVEFAEDATLVELIAIVLARAVERATHRGLLTGYRSREDALPAPRGRILFAEQIRRQQGSAPPVHTRYDELTADILENRLLLSALDRLGRAPLRSATARREVSRAMRAFGAVSGVAFSPRAIPSVVFTRLNGHYRPSIELATLVLQSASIDLGDPGGARGAGFLIDMNKVFERFVRTAIREELGVDRRLLPDKAPPLVLDEAGSVRIEPDLCLLGHGRVEWVGDVKYKPIAAGEQNADLYQALAYATALDLPGATLIYAATGPSQAREHTVLHAGKRVRVVSIDVSVEPRAVRRQVESLTRGLRPGFARGHGFASL